MELEHSFTIPVPPEQAWETLLDVERVAPCMPGATVESVADDVITGRIKVKVGPVTLTYTGKARLRERDASARSVTLEASGRETRGAGTATATVRSMLRGEGDQTEVIVHTSLAVTGRPAQFGRGMLTEVGGKIIDTFAANLAAQLAGGQEAAGGPDAGTDAGAGPDAGTEAGGAGQPAGAVTGPAAGPAAASPALATPIDELKLPSRSTASLRLAGLTTVGDLAASNERTLLGLAGIGPQTVSVIRDKLAALGVGFGGTATEPPAAGYATPAPPAAPGGAPAAAATAQAQPAAQMTASRPRLRPPDEEALDLLNMAGLPVLKRILPAAGVLAAVITLVVMLLRRRRRPSRRA